MKSVGRTKWFQRKINHIPKAYVIVINLLLNEPDSFH